MSRSKSDWALLWSLRALSALAGLIVFMIALFLLLEAWPALRQAGMRRFFSEASWHPPERLYGLAPMLSATLLTTAGAVLLATPLGLLSAFFCRFYAPRPLAGAYRRMIELLAGIPSVVYGFWGLVVLVPLIRAVHPPGPSLLAGILILALMILPMIALTADAAFAAVPQDDLHGAAALGLTRWALVRGVALPAARPALLSGVILATGRALGETMAVLMVCGNVVQTPKSLFAPVRTLSANIALEMSYAMGEHRSALFVGGLVLLAAVALLVAAAEAWRGRQRRRGHD